jgi:hypothetical protein
MVTNPGWDEQERQARKARAVRARAIRRSINFIMLADISIFTDAKIPLGTVLDK